MKRIPTIASVMTPFPYSVEAGVDLGVAVAMMKEHDVQHLPVMEDGRLVGLLWDRDIRVARSLEAAVPTDPTVAANARVGVVVGRVCNREPYVVEMSERLDLVAFEMARRRVGAAVILRGDKLAGILTTTDVCRLLGETLRAQFHVPEDGGDAA